MQVKLWIIGVISLALGACGGGYDLAHYNVMNNVNDGATWASLPYCGGWGCSDRRDIGLTEDEWAEVTAIMEPPAHSAGAERAQVAEAIGLMEVFSGRKTGYGDDRGGTASGFGGQGQLDCYSEAANTSNFLRVLANAGLLRFHVPDDPIMRGMASGRSMRPTHATATLVETETGTLFAMDSWFFDNGHNAVYVDADIWAASWAPRGGASL